MPCEICERFIPSEGQVYQVEENVDGDGRTVYILRTLAGTEKFRVATLDVETISKTLAVRDYRIKIIKKQKLLNITAEKLLWRHQGVDWYFICEKCRDEEHFFLEAFFLSLRFQVLKMKMTVSDSMIIHYSESGDPLLMVSWKSFIDYPLL